MKTRLLPLVALISATAFSSAFAGAPAKGDINVQSQSAYVVDSSGNVVRDGFGYCVRTINWTKETAIAKCEGWEEPKPEVVAEPVAAPVVTPAVAPKPVVVEEVKVDAPAAFTGFFDTNKTVLTTEAKEKLNVYSNYLERNEGSSVKVTGHTDSTGSKAYNQTLSEKRAGAVKNYLESSGIDANRIEAQGLGQTQPTATNSTKAGRAENRRVELEIIK